MKIIILSLIEPLLSLSQDNIDGEWIGKSKEKDISTQFKINHLDSNA